MFRNLPDFLLKHARIAFPWTKTKYTPHFTGIPPHVILMADNERIFAELARIRAGMKDSKGKIETDEDVHESGGAFGL